MKRPALSDLPAWPKPGQIRSTFKAFRWESGDRGGVCLTPGSNLFSTEGVYVELTGEEMLALAEDLLSTGRRLSQGKLT